MKTIKLNKSSIELPSCWEDLKGKQILFTFGMLSQLFSGEITPEHARFKMLIKFTRYRPSLGVWRKIKKKLLYWLSYSFVATKNIYYWTRYGWNSYKDYLYLWRDLYRLDKDEDIKQREIINFNLFRLSEQLDFAFSVEGNKIIPNYIFKSNPIPYIKIGNRKYQGKQFDLDIKAKTNITAHEFVDAFDLLSFMSIVKSEEEKEECINQLCSILYPLKKNHTENVLSRHNITMRKLDPIIKFGIIFWFTGIVKFYMEHPSSKVLFEGRQNSEEEFEDKIRLGMKEILIFLRREGYGPDQMNLNDYFESQIKALKDSVNKAIAAGAKVEDIAQQTGISIATIYKLS